MDRNGSMDLVLANGIWFANPAPGGNPKLDAWARRQIDATTAHDVVLADLDRDGDLDLVKRNQGATGDVIRVFRQGPNVTWTERDIPVPAGEGLELADLDADGDPDIVISGAWYENDGNPISGAWTRYAYTTAYSYPHVLVKVANLGGSSRPDIVLAPREPAGASYRLSWFEAPANPKGLWPEHILESGIETVVHGLALADFDRNGRIDVAYAEMFQGADPDRVRVLLHGHERRLVLGQSSRRSARTTSPPPTSTATETTSSARTGAPPPPTASAKIWLNRTGAAAAAASAPE